MSRKTVSGMILALLLTSMLTLAFNIQSVKADGEYVLSAWAVTTPVMDGVLTFGEWDDAAKVSFTLVSQTLESHPATLYEKNDAQYLYLAVTVLGDDFDSADGVFFYFDNAHDGGLDDGDDWIYVLAGATGQGLAEDGYYNASDETLHSDTTHSGTNDILGGSSHTNVGSIGDYTFELRHPLDSEDDAHDFSLKLGDTVGVRMEFDDAFPGGAYSSPWPGWCEFADIIIASPSSPPEVARLQCMPDFGQHSEQWCWVAAAANCFYWLKHYGGFPNLYPDNWDEIDPESVDPSNNNWYCPCGNGYRTLLKEICKDGDAVHEETLVFCSRFFLDPWWNYVNLYVECLETFIADQEFDNKLEVHTYDNPTFDDYKREIAARSCVIILYQWGELQDIHLVTGVSYNADKSPPEVEVSDPGTSGHNNDPNLKVYDKWSVTSEDPFEANAGTIRYLFCISPRQRMWTVDDDLQERPDADFTKIQNAVDVAVAGDTILVYPGIYTENVFVNKRLTIKSESGAEETIVQSPNPEWIAHVFDVSANYVNINGFTVKEANGNYECGLFVEGSNCRFCSNRILDNTYGIWLEHSNNTVIVNNDISRNGWMGVHLWKSHSNIINGNVINSNPCCGIYLEDSSGNVIVANNITSNNWSGLTLVWNTFSNLIYCNNFNNTVNVELDYGYGSLNNTWDNGYPSGGNYWSDYAGVDADGDGIGDAEYTIDANNTDRYPLMAPFNTFDAGSWNSVTYNVDVISNSTVSDFHFDPQEGPFLRFNVTGDDGAEGFCRVTIPNNLLWVEDGWTVSVGGEPVNYTIIPDEDFTYLYFTYNHTTEIVVIQGTSVIPEFSPTIVLPLFMMIALIAITLTKKKQKKKTK